MPSGFEIKSDVLVSDDVKSIDTIELFRAESRELLERTTPGQDQPLKPADVEKLLKLAGDRSAGPPPLSRAQFPGSPHVGPAGYAVTGAAALGEFRLLELGAGDSSWSGMKSKPKLNWDRFMPKPEGKAAADRPTSPTEASAAKPFFDVGGPERLSAWPLLESKDRQRSAKLEKLLFESKSTSVEFEGLVRKAIEEMPISVKAALVAGGYKIVAAETITRALPELEFDHPRGWPPGLTWNHTDGFQQFDKRIIAVSEKSRAVDAKVKWLPADRTAGVLRHEVGHAIDRLYGTKNAALSESADFCQAYAKDVKRISDADRKRLFYHLQEGCAGRSETFADVFALLIGGPCNESEREVLTRAFPETAAYIKEAARLRAK